MRVLAVSIAPLYPNQVQGGSQRILTEAVNALVQAGHDVRVMCSVAPEGSIENFQTPGGATVEPSLELRGVFPAPYQTSPDRLASAWKTLQAGAAWADRLYLHADAIYMRAALGDLPVVRSLHDFVYEEALLSAFTLPATRTIVPSHYVRNCIMSSAGQVTDPGELVVVPNGVSPVDWPVQPTLPAGVKAREPGDLILLHPHRLHPEKGIKQSLRIAVETQKRVPEQRVRLLVPAQQPEGSADHASLGGGAVMEMASSLGAVELVELHAWLPAESMPGYFAAGDVTLCPGSFVEAFGLVPLESVAAGTPVVCSKAGAFREQQGLKGITHFDFGDISAAANALKALAQNPIDMKSAAEDVSQRYDITRMRTEYVTAITSELRQVGPVSVPGATQTGRSLWKLAPWCYIAQDSIYHDYLARFERFPEVIRLLDGARDSTVSSADLSSREASDELRRARTRGFVVPA